MSDKRENPKDTSVTNDDYNSLRLGQQFIQLTLVVVRQGDGAIPQEVQDARKMLPTSVLCVCV